MSEAKSQKSLALFLSGLAGTLLVLVVAQLVWQQPRERPVDVFLIGTSTAGAGSAENLATEIQHQLGDSVSVSSHLRPADTMADIWAVALDADEKGHKTLIVEWQIYNYNERRNVFAPRPDTPVSYHLQPVLPLVRVMRSHFWKLVFQTNFVENFLRDLAKTQLSAIHAGKWVEGRVKSELYKKLELGRFRTWFFDECFPAPPDNGLQKIAPKVGFHTFRCAVLRGKTGLNLATKVYDRGIDTDILMEFLAWAGKRGNVLLYVPPLNRGLISEIAGEEPSARIEEWGAAMCDRAADKGVECISLVDLMPWTSFSDYAHLKGEGEFEEVAGALVERLRQMGAAPAK